MTVRSSRTPVLRCSVVMARVAAEPQNSREAEVEEDEPVRERTSVVSAARKMEKMAPRVPPHVYVTKINELRKRGNGRNENVRIRNIC